MGLFDSLGKLNYNQLGLAAQLMSAGQGGTYAMGSPPPNQWGQVAGALGQYAQAMRLAQMDELKKKELENRLRVAQEERDRKAKVAALANPQGMLDPKTGIAWNSPRTTDEAAARRLNEVMGTRETGQSIAGERGEVPLAEMQGSVDLLRRQYPEKFADAQISSLFSKSKDSRTSDIKNYEYYKANGGDKSFEEWSMANASSGNAVSIGNPSAFLGSDGKLLPGLYTLQNRPGPGGRPVWQNSETGEPPPPGSTPVTVGQAQHSRSALSGTEMSKLKTSISQSKIDIGKLEKYAESSGGISKGAKIWADQASGLFNTFVGADVTDQQFAAMAANGELSGLVGGLKEIGGGNGVLSDQDVKRLFDILGGKVSAFRNPRVVQAAVQRVMEEKVEQHNDMVSTFNANRNTVPGFNRMYEKYDPIEIGSTRSSGSSVEQPPLLPPAGGTSDVPLDDIMKLYR